MFTDSESVLLHLFILSIGNEYIGLNEYGNKAPGQQSSMNHGSL